MIILGINIDGFLIRPADVGTLSHLLLGLFLGSIPAELMGKNARNKALDIFDTKKMVQETLEAYENILKRSPWVTMWVLLWAKVSGFWDFHLVFRRGVVYFRYSSNLKDV